MDCDASTSILLERMLLDSRIEPINIPLSLLKAITNNFSDHHEIGKGGSAVVYKGLLQNGTIAVKKLFNTEVDEKKFTQEVDSLMRAKHRNVVRFLGYCADTQGKWSKLEAKNVMAEVRQRLLCFEFLPNGSLDQYISDASHGLEWKTRYQIIKGICEGLRYLHKKSILHLDLKPANILLNEDMVPKIADFGVSRCFKEKQSRVLTSKMFGTLGYVAPEYINGAITFKLDIYSLGVIILEILTGRRGYAGVEHVLESWKIRLRTPQGDTWLEQIRVCAMIGTECMDSDPEKRPVIQHIIETLAQIECNGFIETDISTSSATHQNKGSIELQKATTPVVPRETSCELQVGTKPDSCSSYSISPGILHVAQGEIITVADPEQPAPVPVAWPSRFRNIRKYVLIMATLAASVTYMAALNPPGGLWSDNDDAHFAGDPVLQVTYPRRYKVFFYSNATAFVASIITVSLLLVHSLSQCRWWLRVPLQSAMILDQFGLMGAYAAGSCRKLAMSAYVPVVAMVSSCVLFFSLRALGAHNGSKSVAHEIPGTGVESTRKGLLIFVTLMAAVTYQVGLNTPGGVLSESDSQDDDHLAGDPMLLVHNPGRFMVFFYFNSTAFVASLLVITLLMRRTVTQHAFGVLWVCAGVALIGLTGAFAIASSRSDSTPIYIIALVASVLLYIGLQFLVCLCKPVNNWVHNVHETFQNCLKLDQTESHDHEVRAVSDQQTHNADQLLQKSRMYLLLLGILAASVTYQAGLNPPGGFWQANASDGLHHYLAGDPVLHITYPWRYMTFFYCNATAFVASLVILILLLGNRFSTQGIKYCAFQVAMILNLLGLIGAYAAGSCRQVSKSVYISVLVIPVLLYVGIHVLVFMLQVFPNHATWREIVKVNLWLFVDKWLKKLFEVQPEDDKWLNWKLEKRRKLLLFLAILAASLTYQAGMSPPGGFWQENKTGHLIGNPVLNDNYPRRYLAFFYCNATAFIASLGIIMLLVNRKLSARGIQSHALILCTILDLIGLMGAFVAGSTRKVSTSIYIFALVFAVLVCIALQVILGVPESVQRLVHKLLNFLGILEERSSDILPYIAAPGEVRDLRDKMLRKYLFLFATFAAAVTYQASMSPPGGLWDDGQTIHIAGDPVLQSSYPRRYKAFFYCNATSFMASLVIMFLLLIKPVCRAKSANLALHVAMILDLFGLMGAYAAGSCRRVTTSAYILALLIGVSAYIVILVVVSIGVAKWLKRVMNKMVEKNCGIQEEGCTLYVEPGAMSMSIEEETCRDIQDVAPSYQQLSIDGSKSQM